MILVTVGTHNQGFDRLVTAMDELAAKLHEQVVIQQGSSPYEPRYAEHFQWASSDQMEQLTRDARVVVTHAAAGSILLALRIDKPLIVVPRLQRFGEHMDDHQQQLAAALDAQGKAVAVTDPNSNTLRVAIEKITQQKVQNAGANQLIRAIREQLDAWGTSKLQQKN